MAKKTLEGRDVKFVKQYIQPKPFNAEAWYYGLTKVKKDEMVIRVGIDQEAGLISLLAAANQSASLVGLLAELGHDMIKLAARQGVTLKAVTDQLVKDELLAASYLLEERLREAAAREVKTAKQEDEIEDFNIISEESTKQKMDKIIEPEPTEIILPDGDRQAFDPTKLQSLIEGLEEEPTLEFETKPKTKDKSKNLTKNLTKTMVLCQYMLE